MSNTLRLQIKLSVSGRKKPRRDAYVNVDLSLAVPDGAPFPETIVVRRALPTIEQALQSLVAGYMRSGEPIAQESKP